MTGGAPDGLAIVFSDVDPVEEEWSEMVPGVLVPDRTVGYPTWSVTR